MTTPDDPERVYPGDRQVVDVMDAAAGASEEDVIRCLQYLREERGLWPGTKHGPRHFSWFKTLVANYFQQKRNREMVFAADSAPKSKNAATMSTEEFDSMTEAIEIDGGAV